MENGFKKINDGKPENRQAKMTVWSVSIGLVLVCDGCGHLERRMLLTGWSKDHEWEMDQLIKRYEEDGWVIMFDQPDGQIVGAVCANCKGKGGE